MVISNSFVKLPEGNTMDEPRPQLTSIDYIYTTY